MTAMLLNVSICFLGSEAMKSSKDIGEEMAHPVGHLAEVHVSLEGPKSKSAAHSH